MRTSIIVTLFIFAICSALAAQNSPPAAVFRGHCSDGVASYREWFQQTPLPHGEPYFAPGKRKEQILERYSKLKLQMSLEEVEKLLGGPDFSSPRPDARLAAAPKPEEQQCSNQFAYIVKKSSENMADVEDVAIYLFFSEDGKLYWASPQNLPNFTPLGSPREVNGLAFAQLRTASWKEYVFADEGFAITLPEAPNPHPDPVLPDMTVDTVSLLPGAGLTLRVSHEIRDCTEVLAQLKDDALKVKSGTEPSSEKDVSVDGYPGVEFQYNLDANRSSFHRFYCVNGRFYTFSSVWPSTQPLPAAAVRIVSSFRLLNIKPSK
jgi:hypothetical protein